MNPVSVENATPPFTFFSKMLFFDCVTGRDKRIEAWRAVVSRYSSSPASRSQSLRLWVRGHVRTERRQRQEAEIEERRYLRLRQRWGGELHQNVCSFTAQLKSSLRRKGMSLCAAFAGNAGLKVFRCDSSCAMSITEKPNITHSGALVGKIHEIGFSVGHHLIAYPSVLSGLLWWSTSI